MQNISFYTAEWNCNSRIGGHTRKVGPDTQDPINGTWDPEPQYDQVGPETQDPLRGTRELEP